ncbi:molecular chaperone DnaJ [Croceicoccus sp. F390]|uniref:Molecular chaperone DnaJ n=1 Tax=Croceicoccus esteveae TaxID=3075597 RepID=A0ABU2ZGJ5_9SPHN|nr:molecular chaperone DnaJ [Croceicoccus sp. F390]MDT0575710.1 molecular chaperone DnaJ [Croceicoccus sp. F390]
MAKLLILVFLAIIMCRMVFNAWPWQLWQTSTTAARQRQDQLVNAREVLQLPAGAGRQDIVAAHRRAVLDAHPDHGGSAEAMYRIDAARDLLLEQLPSKTHQ